MFRAKTPGTDLSDIAAFFKELVSRSRRFLSRPVRIHFVAEFSSEKTRQTDGMGDVLPFLRTVLFDETQNTVSNPQAALCVHTPPAEGKLSDIFAEIASAVEPAGDDFFVIVFGSSAIRKAAVKDFAALREDARRRLSLFHLQKESGLDAVNGLVTAMRILLRGEDISPETSALRILQGKM